MEEPIYYKAKYTRDINTGVYGVSLVGMPAMKGTPVFLNKDKKQEVIKFKTLNEEKRLVLGMIMQPDLDIYRCDEKTGKEYYIRFDADTIRELAYDFIENGYQKNSSLEHETEIDGVSIVETWIVEDPEMDKTKVYGLSETKGSWVGAMRIQNDEVWLEYCKTGKIGGFSIDAVVELEQVNLKSNINMSKEVLEETQKQTSILSDVLNAVKLAFTPKEKEAEQEVKLGSVKTQDGKIVIEFDGDELVVGASAWIMADEVTKVPVPVGEHPLEDGKVLVVTEEGIVGEVKDAVAEEAPAEPQAEEMAKEPTQAPSDTEIVNEIANDIKSILVKYTEVQADVKEIKTSLSKALKENEELKVALNEQPATKPKKSQPAQAGTKLTLTERLNAKL